MKLSKQQLKSIVKEELSRELQNEALGDFFGKAVQGVKKALGKETPTSKMASLVNQKELPPIEKRADAIFPVIQNAFNKSFGISVNATTPEGKWMRTGVDVESKSNEDITYKFNVFIKFLNEVETRLNAGISTKSGPVNMDPRGGAVGEPSTYVCVKAFQLAYLLQGGQEGSSGPVEEEFQAISTPIYYVVPESQPNLAFLSLYRKDNATVMTTYDNSNQPNSENKSYWQGFNVTGKNINEYLWDTFKFALGRAKSVSAQPFLSFHKESRPEDGSSGFKQSESFNYLKNLVKVKN